VYAGTKGLMNQIGFDHQIVVNEFCRLHVIGVNAANSGSRNNDVVNFFAAKKIPNRGLLSEIQLRSVKCNQIPESAFLQGADDSAADHAAVTGDENIAVRMQGHKLLGGQ